MASSSSSSSITGTWKYNVFVSFHGPDTRKSFLSHFRKQFKRNGITMFNDQEIVRGDTIAPALTQGIRESRISILILSKYYASSSWCLDELLEILECKEAVGQIVMTVFYGVDPSDVRKQTGDFGVAFNKTCAGKTEKRFLPKIFSYKKQRKKMEKRDKWARALTVAANIAGEDFQKWDNESEMIGKIAKDVLDKLHRTPSRDFDGMVGLGAHLRQMESMLELDSVEVKMMVAISGPAGIGKTTIARALQNLHSNRFDLTCFMDNLRESCHSGLDVLRLQKDFLSKALNHDGIRICHSGVIKERLCDQRVLVILDDVNNIKQLEALVGEISWFGPGSRIVVTTENKELLQQHGINNTYDVGFPSDDQALKILCKYAFGQSYPRNEFKEHAKRVTELCGNLPLGLRVLGSSLRGMEKDDWEYVIRKLETDLPYQDMEQVLRVGFEGLDEKEQDLFIHIAVFFSNNDGELVEAMFAEDKSKLDIKHGLKILANRSLIYISTHGEIVMHKLLQQLGTKVARREEPWKHRILIDADVICKVLGRAKGTGLVSSILFDTSGIYELSISSRAFTKMPKLRFLKVIKSKDEDDGNESNDIVHVPVDMDFPHHLRLLDWKAYPGKCLPHTFSAKFLVELNLKNSHLEKLWEGSLALTNLKRIDLSRSLSLSELPDLANATNLESLCLDWCESLVEIPSFIGNFHKLMRLSFAFCSNLQVVPTNLNLRSLEDLSMFECPQLRTFPDISTNIIYLTISDTMLEELPTIWLCSRLRDLQIYHDIKSPDTIEKLPDWIKDFHGLIELSIAGCQNLASLPELPGSLRKLIVNDCQSLETVNFSLDYFINELYLINCFSLSQEAEEVIIQQSLLACLPGSTVPAEFDHPTIGNSLTIRSDFKSFRICAVVSPKMEMMEDCSLFCRIHLNGCFIGEDIVYNVYQLDTEHLFMSDAFLHENEGWLEKDNEISFEFSTSSHDIDVIECGVQMWTDETDGSISSDGSYEQMSEDDDESLLDGSNEFDEPRVKRLKT